MIQNIRWNIWKLFGNDLTEQDERENMQKCVIRWFNSCSIKLIIFLYCLFCFKADEKEERYLRRQKRRAELDSKQKEKEEDVNASKKQEKTEAEESVPKKGTEGANFLNNLGHHFSQLWTPVVVRVRIDGGVGGVEPPHLNLPNPLF